MSRTALITDIHANRQAFDAVLEHASQQGVDRYAFLGDFIGYGADPAWVLQRVQALCAKGAIAVQGNHDRAVAQGPMPHMTSDARHMVEWTRAQLSPEDIAWLKALPLTRRVEDCFFAHANAFAPEQFAYIHGRLDAVRSLQASPCTYSFFGHMHEPRLYHLSSTGKAGDFTPEPGTEIPLLPHRRWLAIAGSCGQPRDGNPAACYAVFDSDQQVLSFQRVPYDVDTAAQCLTAAQGLNPELAQRLATRLQGGQ
ncbi:metallophosphoesterase family protein [Roseateles sp. BYS180W]|uniref:Metallophosphoesterase family protein n=1 Tax=Roseateles rivi TaxID=3299028 RepID=A0ABW7FYR9_9BURK